MEKKCYFLGILRWKIAIFHLRATSCIWNDANLIFRHNKLFLVNSTRQHIFSKLNTIYKRLIQINKQKNAYQTKVMHCNIFACILFTQNNWIVVCTLTKHTFHIFDTVLHDPRFKNLQFSIRLDFQFNIRYDFSPNFLFFYLLLQLRQLNWQNMQLTRQINVLYCAQLCS